MAIPPTLRTFAAEAWAIHEKAASLWNAVTGLLVVALAVAAGLAFGAAWGVTTFATGLLVWSTATGLLLARKLAGRDDFHVTFHPRATMRNGAWTLRVGIRNDSTPATFTAQAEWTIGGRSFGYVPVSVCWTGTGPGERQIRSDETADIDLLHIRQEGERFSCAFWVGSGAVDAHRKVVPHDEVGVRVTVWCVGKDVPQSTLVYINTNDPNTPRPRMAGYI